MPRPLASSPQESQQIKPIFQAPKLTTARTFECLEDVVLSLLYLLRPPERLTVSQAAAKYRYIHSPGSYTGMWDNSMVPYMIEPMNELTSAEFKGLIFAGPAQSSKTDSLAVNWVLFGVVCDPMDMTIYSPTMAASRDFSLRRIDRLHLYSKPVGALLNSERGSDNQRDKHYKNGMMLSLSWPSASEFAGKPIPRLLLTDYDRMDEDIEGEGSPYDLASKRSTTFGSFAMTVAESSPSRELTNHNWIAETAHQAPPTTGILALYNRGDRRRWYWPCLHCWNYFEGEFRMLKWEDKGDKLLSSETVHMECPCCGERIMFDDRQEMQQWGTWLKDGQRIDKKGRKIGTAVRSSTASFWLKGVAATFVSWKQLVENYITALQEYQLTGSEDALRKFYNTDLGEIYMPLSLQNERIPEHLKARAEVFCEDDQRVVPWNVRFLIATIDVQKNMFVVQVHGILPGTPFDMVLVDRFNLVKSERVDLEGERYWVKPGAYPEDWEVLIEQVMEKEYALQGDDTRRMAIKMTLCDSGGKEGVTTNAYSFYRKLKQLNKHGRFQLVKGDHGPTRPRVSVTFPDAQRKDRNAGARGDVPVLLLNSNLIKDALAHRLDCITPGAGVYRFPSWAPDFFYRELCSEVRDPAKGWLNPSHSRNEAWDLSCYCIAGCISKFIRVEQMDWENPPGWAAPWEKNDLIHLVTEPKRFAQEKQRDYDFAKFGAELAG